MNSCLLPWPTKPFQLGLTLKVNNLMINDLTFIRREATRPGPDVIKIFVLNSAENEIFPA